MAALAQLDVDGELPAQGAVWAALTHPQKHVLLHERILAAATDDGTAQPYRPCSDKFIYVITLILMLVSPRFE